jgi:hypothetical protein
MAFAIIISTTTAQLSATSAQVMAPSTVVFMCVPNSADIHSRHIVIEATSNSLITK